MPGERTISPCFSGRSTLPSTSTSPSTSAIILGVTPPGRSTRTGVLRTSTTVDSRPTSHAPPSMIIGTRPSMSASTCAAVVGLGLPERFALGAATGTPQAVMNACATGCDGNRTPTLSSPAHMGSISSSLILVAACD